MIDFSAQPLYCMVIRTSLYLEAQTTMSSELNKSSKMKLQNPTNHLPLKNENKIKTNAQKTVGK
jgi:hypothetical protein